MKRMYALILVFAMVLTMAACGSKPAAETTPAAPADLAALYAELESKLPTMMVLDEATMMNFLGIDAGDCAQVVAAVCGDGLAADEVWLIEAKDADALARVKELAETRMTAKAEETVNYTPDQYAIVEKGQIVVKDLYLALLVSPDVDAMKAAFEEAVK